MTSHDSTLDLTPRQVLAIYRAGVERGSDEASSYEWGCSPRSRFLGPLEEAMAWSADFDGIRPEGYDERKAWWEAYAAELEA